MEASENKGWVRDIELTPPSLHDNTADADRLAGALKKELETEAVDIELELLKRLPATLRESEYKLRCVLFRNHGRWILIDAVGENKKIITGLAVDLGTTRVVLRLIDLVSHKTLGETAFDNPQISVGPDILSRIHFADQTQGLEKVNKLIINGLNQEIDNLCEQCGIRPVDIYLLSIAGNTAMTHLFMGLYPGWIIREPYIPVVNSPGVAKASALGLRLNPLAVTLIFPNIGSYFGGDLIAGILFSGLHKRNDTAILVDVGTNAEVVLGNQSWVMACAGAAGPALEGGVTKMGMMAGPGVIDRVAIDPESYEFQIHTIGNKTPRGICGSGLIDLAAHLFLSGMIDIRGRFVPARCDGRLKNIKGIEHLVVVPGSESSTGADLTISQVDLDSLIRSKAAMYTILETITSSVGILLNELPKFYVAGTFGSFINPKSAIAIGMLPDLPVDTYQSLGNSSLGGASMALAACEHVDEIDGIRDSITYLELNVNQDFMNRFSAARFLPHTNRALFPSVKQGAMRKKYNKL
jgi:uncharacterized 2Fe-2S/4Fe-4S cluster protein (DUF4445 family)